MPLNSLTVRPSYPLGVFGPSRCSSARTGHAPEPDWVTIGRTFLPQSVGGEHRARARMANGGLASTWSHANSRSMVRARYAGRRYGPTVLSRNTNAGVKRGLFGR
jgi:hypothetical protein